MNCKSVHAPPARNASPSSQFTGSGVSQVLAPGQTPLTTEVFEGGIRPNQPGDASIGINTYGWYEGMRPCGAHWASTHPTDDIEIGTAVTCASLATCGFSSTFRACCVNHACSSSVFNTACLPYDDPDCLAGTHGPATKCWSVCFRPVSCHRIANA